jgi:hypothetical protein
MQDRKWFLPNEGMTIPDPHTQKPCPGSGQWVAASDEYWIRRELDGGGRLLDGPPPGSGPEGSEQE